MIKNSIGRIDPLKFMVGAIGIAFICLIVATCGLYMKASDLSHENELLVAQKETLQEVLIDMPQCDTGRFKYDPNVDSIYDNETKSIYRKVGE